MKTLLLFLLCWLIVQTVRAEDPIPALTVDGVTYSNVTFGTVTPTKVTIFYSRGIASIPLEKLSPELQKRFGYDPQKAAEWHKAQAQATADRQKAEQQEALRKKLSAKPLLDHPKIGDAGIISDFAVLQVLGTNEMLVTLHLFSQGQLNEAKAVYGVDGIIVGIHRPFDSGALVKGFPTVGLVDGQRIEENKTIFSVTGTTNYVTVSKARRTVYILEPWKADEPPKQDSR